MITIETAKSIPLTSLLEALGYSPARQGQNSEVWYHSPFRNEKTPSFKVKSDCVWYDHGIAYGGTIIDFGLRYRRTDSVKDVLKWLSQFAYLANQQIQVSQHIRATESRKTHINDVKPLSRYMLLHYLREDRKIDLAIARQHLKEIDFTVNDKTFSALGFPNRSGGWELRNAWYKGCSSPKDVSVIKSPHNPKNRILVFEGFMDYLSVLTQLNRKQLPNDVMVLNSVALQERAIELIGQGNYRQIDTYFDNDRAGEKATKRFEQLLIKVVPQNHQYSESKDVNDYHIQMHQIGYTR